MPRAQPTLHEAMRTILLDRPSHSASASFISEENRHRDLYRQKDGDGCHPPTPQIRARAKQYPEWFEKPALGVIRLRKQ